MALAKESENPVSDAKFGVTFEHYFQTFAQYREFVAIVEAALEQSQTSDKASFKEMFASSVSMFTTRASKEELGRFGALMKSFLAKYFPQHSSDEGERGHAATGAPEARVSLPDEELTAENSPRVIGAFLRVLKLLRRHGGQTERQSILYHSVLTGLVGRFEVLIADLAAAFYKSVPAAVGSQDPVLTVEELLSFSTLEDAVDFVIEKKVDDLLRQNLDDWSKFFQTRMKIDIAKLSPDWPRFAEHIQRRHLLVHADGRLSRRYLRAVPPELVREYFGEAEIGHRATLSSAYVRSALNSFEVTGLLLCSEVWLKLRPGDKDSLSHALIEFTYDTLVEARWECARELATWLECHKEFSQSARLVGQFNRWLCMKRLSRWEEVRAEVEAFDSSALGTTYVLVRHSLLDQKDEFFELLASTKGVDLDDRGWDQWPIFSEMRADPRFEKLKSEFAPTKRAPISLAPPEHATRPNDT